MISNLASVSKDAQLGQNVKVEPFTTIYEDVVIGNNTVIGPNVTIYPGTRIGEDCEIYPGSVIGVIPQDLKFGGEYTTVEIGNNTKIRECVTIHRYYRQIQNSSWRQLLIDGICTRCPRLYFRK